MNGIKDLLEEKYLQYNRPDFIAMDPISIPHLFSKKQDIEIAGFIAATLAWGQRKTIISKCLEIFKKMDHAPYDFITQHDENDLKVFANFKHRTFNDTDLLYFIHFLKKSYQRHNSMETIFLEGIDPGAETVEGGINNLKLYFEDDDSFPSRTSKHVASPARKSACKRINMFLRWMVRKDDRGVDFGIWKGIKPQQLVCPFDIHVERVARRFGLITRKMPDWQTALELTLNLRAFDPKDPVKYDFALFGLGIHEGLR